MNVKLHLANRKIDEKLILCLKTIWRTFFLRLKIARLAIPIGQAVAVCEYAFRRHFDGGRLSIAKLNKKGNFSINNLTGDTIETDGEKIYDAIMSYKIKLKREIK